MQRRRWTGGEARPRIRVHSGNRQETSDERHAHQRARQLIECTRHRDVGPPLHQPEGPREATARSSSRAARASTSTTTAARNISRGWPACGAPRSASARSGWSRRPTRQMRQLPYYHTFAHKSHEPAIELAERLLAHGAGADVEGVLRQLRLGGQRHARSSWSGTTTTRSAGRRRRRSSRASAPTTASRSSAASLTGLPANHRDFDLPIANVIHTDCPHHYRFARARRKRGGVRRRAWPNSLEELILREGPDTVAAFIAEPVMGAGGVIVPPASYFEKIQAVLKKYDVLFIADEVICGFGRTGNMFGCADLRHQARHHDDGQGAVLGLPADLGRADLRADLPRDGEREREDRHLRPRLHLLARIRSPRRSRSRR